MPVAVISDIHSNLHALEAVLEAIDARARMRSGASATSSATAPRPDECCGIVEERAAVCLAGTTTSASAATSTSTTSRRTRLRLRSGRAACSGSGPRSFCARSCPRARPTASQLFHASPRDPVWEYILTDQAALAALEATSAPVVLVGHSHVPLAVTADGGSSTAATRRPERSIELGEHRWLLNPGSVGQPRDGDPRAAWLLLDLDARRASFRRVDYAIAETQAEIREAGLPQILGDRLVGRRLAAVELGRLRRAPARALRLTRSARRLPG